MHIGSKVAIKDIREKLNDKEEKFYVATLVELVYNNNAKNTFKWENAFYTDVCIFTTLNLEKAIFDKPVGKKKRYSKENDCEWEYTPDMLDFGRISNPENSIIRVREFSATPLTRWINGVKIKGKYRMQIHILKCDYERPIWQKYTSVEKYNLMQERGKNKKLKTTISNLKKTIKQQTKDIKLLENKLFNNVEPKDDNTIINYNHKRYKDRV